MQGSFGPTGNPAGYASAWPSQPQTFFTPAMPSNPGPWGNPQLPTASNPGLIPQCFFNPWGFPTQWCPPMAQPANLQPSNTAPSGTSVTTGLRMQPAVGHTDTAVSLVSDSDDESPDFSCAGNSATSLPVSKEILRNPHRKDKGNPISDEVIQWWEELRTHKLSPEDHKEELSSFAVPEEQEKYFSAPELPTGIKKVFKQVNPSIVAQDDRLRTAQSYALKAALPLLRLFEAVADPDSPTEINKDLVLDLTSSGLILLGSASQGLASTRQRAFDDVVDKKFDTLKRNQPSMGELFGSSLMKDIEETERANKLAAKVTSSRSHPSSSKDKRFSPYQAAFRVSRNRRFPTPFKQTYRGFHGRQSYRSSSSRGRGGRQLNSSDNTSSKN